MSFTLPVHNRKLTPTDISQFIRLDRCERFLHLRVYERVAGHHFLTQANVAPQAISPLLSRSGGEFEATAEAAMRARFPLRDFAQEPVTGEGKRLTDNARTLEQIGALPPGEVLILCQPRLEVTLGGWLVRGDLDILRLERDAEGALSILIADAKSATHAKVEHRLQVAFYHAMIARLLEEAGIAARIETGILYRGPAEDVSEEFAAQRDAAARLLGVPQGLLEVVADAEAYLMEVADLVVGPHSSARRIADLPFDSLFFTLGIKCDGCLYNEFCLKDSFERGDLSLLPFLSSRDKRALLNTGVTDIASLATLKEFHPETKELTPEPGRATTIQNLSATSAGPRLDELILRACRSPKLKSLHLTSPPYIPGKGHSTLPYTDAAHNPNLVCIYIDAQRDYLHDRVYLIGALVVACENGVPTRRRSVVCLADGPPDSPEKEAALFGDWVSDTLRAVVELAAPDAGGERRAPIHLVFWNDFEQKTLLDALARNFSPMVAAAPALYDFVTQIAAYDSPLATFLDAEIREQKNYPMLCQSLHAVASYLKFDWNDGADYKGLFREKLFDDLGRSQDDEWYARRSRFSSQVPLEYAWAAWDILPKPDSADDPFLPYRAVTEDHLRGFQARRLEAVEWICRDFRGNPLTEKTSFLLPDLAEFSGRASHLAQALSEFVAIERHVDLAAWKSARQLAPERRALLGETLLVRYLESDQEPEVAAQNRDNEYRRELGERYRAQYRLENPQAKQVRLPKAQKEECDWDQTGMRFRLRLETEGMECDLETILGVQNFRQGDYFVLFPRFAYDERLPLAERTPNTPTPKQMLYGTRAELIKLEVNKDEGGRAMTAFADVEIRPSFGGPWSQGFLFPSIERPLTANDRYTLDPDPNDIYGYWQAKVTEGLCAVADGANPHHHALYDRLTSGEPGHVNWPEAASLGQNRFLEGMDALHAISALHDFEPGKRDFIGSHGADPILLVQGPPGTGKSYSTAYAVLARLQGAIAAGLNYRVFLSCKTHSATDVLLEALLSVRNDLQKLRAAHSDLWQQYFDPRLLSIPLLRMSPKKTSPDGIFALRKDSERIKGEAKCADEIQSHAVCVIGATPGGIYGPIKDKWDNKNLFGHAYCDLLVLDEASQMSLPEAIMASLPLKTDGQLVVVGDPRQMPPIVKHEWENEPRRTFQEYKAYASLFETLLPRGLPLIQFAESFRLHSVMAEFLRREIYQQDGIAYHSQKTKTLPPFAQDDDFVRAVLSPNYPLIVVVHDEDASQNRNPFEQDLIGPLLRALAHPEQYGLKADTGLGVVVPHRAQRAALRSAFPELTLIDPETNAILAEAVDTVERYQGEERDVILVSATESDREYLQISGAFLLDPRRLTVALSRAKKKMVLIASRSVFSYFSADEQLFLNSQIWKNLLRRTCTELLWEGERDGRNVSVWGCPHK